MTRHLLLVAILGLLTTPLPAAERFIPARRPRRLRAGAGVDSSHRTGAIVPRTWRSTSRTNFEEALNDEALPSEDVDSLPTATSAAFTPVCDCGCQHPVPGSTGATAVGLAAPPIVGSIILASARTATAISREDGHWVSERRLLRRVGNPALSL